MIKAYFNYPNPHITIHFDPSCKMILSLSKPDSRVVNLSTTTITAELQKFANNQYPFASVPEKNDLWLVVDFKDPEFEEALVRYIHRLFSSHYRPFERVEIVKHSC